MGKDLSVGVLLDFYGELLTQKQKDALDLYYNQDLSLAEIAEHMDISRQGVRDFIKRGEKQLSDFETALGLVHRSRQANGSIAQLLQTLELLRKTNPDAGKLIEQLSAGLSKLKDLI